MGANQQRDDEIEIDLREIFAVLISKMGIIILAGMICALVSLVGTKLFITPQYQSVTKMYVLSQANSETLTSSDMSLSSYLTKDYAELIKSRTVAENVIAQLGLELKPEELLEKVTVSTQTDTRIVTIIVEDEDPYMACELADMIREASSAQIMSVMNSEAVNVVDVANIPDEPSSPSIMKNTLIGGSLGVFLAVAIILIQYLVNDTIKSAEDVEKYLQLSTLGTIPMNRTEANKKKRKIKAGKRR